VRTDLEDLYDRFVWAERHPIEVQEIAKAGTAWATDFVSHRKLSEEYERFFHRQTGSTKDELRTASLLDKMVS
jgi:hypothetical protein